MKDYTDITLILDKSGSMEPLRSDTIGSVNGFIDEQSINLVGSAQHTNKQYADNADQDKV